MLKTFASLIVACAAAAALAGCTDFFDPAPRAGQTDSTRVS